MSSKTHHPHHPQKLPFHLSVFLKMGGIFIFFVIFILLSIHLFAPKTYENLKNRLVSPFRANISQEEELVIVFPDTLVSFDPVSYNASNRSRLVNMYETLVRMDSSLRVEPALALSWGFSSDTVSEFHLRPGVLFHDGTLLTAEDVRSSIEYARSAPNSEVRHLVSSITKIETPDASTVRLTTDFPDPLLLQKLTAIFIFPAKNVATISEAPVGTGAYVFQRYNETKDDLELQRFSSYWGDSPVFRYVIVRGVPDRQERMLAISTGGADILAAVPASMASSLSAYDLDLKVFPSLEVNFLAFAFRPESVFSKKEARTAVSLAINSSELLKFSGSAIELTNQFVSRGVFGYRSDISDRVYDMKKAEALMRGIESFVRIAISVDFPVGFEALGSYLEDQLYRIGFAPEVHYLSVSDLTKKVMSGKSDLYLFGFRSELGDAHDFFEAVAHSRTSDDSRFGVFNGSSYRSDRVDELITESSRTLDTAKRSEKLQEIMNILVEKDIFGVPLFASKVMYAVKSGIHFEPRIDGYIFARDIS